MSALHRPKKVAMQYGAYGGGFGSAPHAVVGGYSMDDEDIPSTTLPSTSADLVAPPSPQGLAPDLSAAMNADGASWQQPTHPAAALAPPDIRGANTAYDPGRQENKPAVMDAVKAATTAQSEGAPPQSVNNRLAEDLKGKMMQQYDATMARAAEKKAAWEQQEKSWSSLGGKIMGMFGGVSQQRMARRAQAANDIKGEYGLAEDLADKLRGRNYQLGDELWHSGGPGEIPTQLTPGKRHVKRDLITTLKPDGTPVFNERVYDENSVAPSKMSPLPIAEGETPFDPKLAAIGQKDAASVRLENIAKIKAERDKLIAAGRLAEAARYHDMLGDYMKTKADNADVSNQLKRDDLDRKKESSDQREAGRYNRDDKKRLQKIIDSPNSTEDQIAEAKLALNKLEQRIAHPGGPGGGQPAPAPAGGGRTVDDWHSVPVGRRFTDGTHKYMRTATGRDLLE